MQNDEWLRERKSLLSGGILVKELLGGDPGDLKQSAPNLMGERRSVSCVRAPGCCQKVLVDWNEVGPGVWEANYREFRDGFLVEGTWETRDMRLDT